MLFLVVSMLCVLLRKSPSSEVIRLLLHVVISMTVELEQKSHYLISMERI